MTNNELIELTEDVKTKISEHGWIQGCAIAPEGVCLRGGLALSLGYNVTSWRHFCADLRRREWEDSFSSFLKIYLVSFNDEPGRTYDEVMDKLDAFIKELRNAE